MIKGIVSDLTIEQTLKKVMSVEGGPFKRGATESVVYKWIRGVIYSRGDFFIQYSPFPDTDAILSIATGITGDKDINCYDALEQGLMVMKKADGQNLRELKLSRNDKIKPLFGEK
ncbi:uncharacterized protein TNCV_1342481 [Trichonephila clavipes]|uniref:Uncharacterized protein n=1 Tax=Trichonephila clavipes TaxID=2585209 RepID=A0A8X6RTW9_TRICX|nr:uncharacterized protein TNCV_1342481 [Trichonephila clavipes]